MKNYKEIIGAITIFIVALALVVIFSALFAWVAAFIIDLVLGIKEFNGYPVFNIAFVVFLLYGLFKPSNSKD